MAQQLIVEGKDAIVVANLLKKRGLPPPKDYTNPTKFRDEFVLNAGGYDKVLIALREALDKPDLANIGLVIDANEAGAAARWQAIVNILLDKLPEEVIHNVPLQANGMLITGENLPRIGIWIMPDNQSNGYLEHFIAGMVPDGDSLWRYAEKTITSLESEGLSRFPPAKRQKALLHTWLSWQDEPGRPFGQAVELGYLNAHAPAMDGFAQWFQLTFQLEGT